MMRRAMLILALALPCARALAQTLPEDTRFEVASVKPSTAQTGGTYRPTPSGFTTTGTLEELARLAYQLPLYRVVAGDAWTKIKRYEVKARIAGPRVRGDTWVMLRNLLKDRFGLRAHRESRSLEVFELRRLRPDTLGPNIRRPNPPCATSGTDLTARCGYTESVGNYEAKGLPIATIAGYLERLSGRPIVDLTTLTGAFDASLRFNPSVGPVPGSTTTSDAEPEDRPLIFTAVREQLGLKLEPATAPMEVLVIDAATKPGPD
jgi:uncharacterized protein (TIGR03435 family)